MNFYQVSGHDCISTIDISDFFRSFLNLSQTQGFSDIIFIKFVKLVELNFELTLKKRACKSTVTLLSVMY